ncbi:hypothetical protein E6R60_05770 [Streptomyces sp. A0642]|uniref:hypothetical protein n=1 Tax=Streptomyces sp. A0642 TaxID=2563100 RepID=UPI0010A22353|nr:hypothetical protein [Streptomyces sp. A0642]THA78392.1 hypothetical protein E6R60_05770 [Streptomyces sp. A0642]
MPQPAAPHPSASTTAPIHVGQLLAWAEAHDNKAVFRMGQQAVELLRELHGLYVTGEEAQRPETGLPAEQPCTDPRHTGAIRERLGCSGPDPATT